MSSNEEIITLQLGNYSNFVGTHYWNNQFKRLYAKNDEINHLKLYREISSTRNNEYQPRVICFDSRNNLKTLKQDGGFSTKNNEDIYMQDDELSIFEQTAWNKNELTTKVTQNQALPEQMNLDNVVTTWSDFMTYKLHPNSMQLLSNQFTDEFNYFGCGEREYLQLFDEVEDKLHYWIEECNSLEGFQVMLDMHDGFSGLSCKMLEQLCDDYEKKSSLAFINWPSLVVKKEHSIYRTLNIALTIQNLCKFSTSFTLQSLQKSLFDDIINTRELSCFEYKADLPYHTSAILSSVFDSVTLPWRQTKRSLSLTDMCHCVSNGKLKLSGTAFGFPLRNVTGESRNLLEILSSTDDFSFLDSLFPVKNTANDKNLGQCYILQDILPNRLQPDHISNSLLQRLGLNNNIFCNNPVTVIDYFTERFSPCEDTISKCFYAKTAMDIKTPYPNILPNTNEDISTNTTENTVMSSIYTSKYFYVLLHDLVMKLRRVNLHKYAAVEEFGLDKESMEELIEDMISLAKEYDPHRSVDEVDDEE